MRPRHISIIVDYRMVMFSKKHFDNAEFGIETWIYIILAMVQGFVVPQINRWIFPQWVSPVDISAMTAILSSIASGMITLTGLVFSLVFVLVQFGSGTYSPRITRIFAHIRVLRHSLGIFTGTFLYSLMALRMIGMEQTENVSGLTVWLAFLWLLTSIAVLAKLVHVFTTLTITNVLTVLGRLGRQSIARVYSTSTPIKDYDNSEEHRFRIQHDDLPTVQSVMYTGEPGYVIDYNIESLVDLARESNTSIYLPYSIGDALKDGAPIALVKGYNPSINESEICNFIEYGRERAFYKDPKTAFRLLVDTAIRALSPAINDPTTAVQVLDQIEFLLHRLGNVHLDIGEVCDSDGEIRLVYKTPSWDDYLQLGLSEIMQYGAASIQVQRRLEALLLFLRKVVPPERLEAVVLFSELRRTVASVSIQDKTFGQWANIPDCEGIGSGTDRLDRLISSF